MLSNRNLMDNNFCTTDKDHPEKEVYLNILPIHHVFCINGDVFTVMRYGSVLCLNRDIARLADVLGHSSMETTRIYLVTTGVEHLRQMEKLGLVS